MELKALQEKKLEIEANFDELVKEKQTHVDEVTRLDTELVKLQGEYRLIDDLINKSKEKETKKNG